MKFIWAGKRARLKLKIMCDVYERGGLQVLNFKIYYEAVCLSWLSKWISLQDKKLLNVEGFDKKQGWHAYLYYDKAKRESSFKHHYVCLPLLNCWLKYKLY